MLLNHIDFYIQNCSSHFREGRNDRHLRPSQQDWHVSCTIPSKAFDFAGQALEAQQPKGVIEEGQAPTLLTRILINGKETHHEH